MTSTEEQIVDKRDVSDILDAEGKEFEKVSHRAHSPAGPSLCGNQAKAN